MSNLSDLLPAGAAAKQLTFTDSGSGISSKAPVALNSDGTVSAVSGQTFAIGSPYAMPLATLTTWYVGVTYHTGEDKIVVLWIEDTTRNLYLQAGSISGTDISWGSRLLVDNAIYSNQIADICYDSNANCLNYSWVNSAQYVRNECATLSGTTFTRDNSNTISVTSTAISRLRQIFDPTNNKVALALVMQSTTYGEFYSISISGTTPTASASLAWSGTSGVDIMDLVHDPDEQRVIIGFTGTGSAQGGVVLVDQSSSTPTASSITQYQATNAYATQVAYDTTNDKLVIGYYDNANSGYTSFIAGTVNASGGTVSFGTKTTTSSALYRYPSDGDLIFDPANNILLYSYVNGDTTSPSNYGNYLLNLSLSGTTVSVDGQNVLDAATGSSDYWANGRLVFDPDANKPFLIYRDVGDSNAGKGIVITPGFTNSQSFVGIADSAISASAAGSVIVQGGTVTGMTLPTNNEANALSTFENAGETYGIYAVYNPDADRVVISYCDSSNSDYLTLISGSVGSDGTITWGTNYVVTSNTYQGNFNGLCYDTTNNKLVVVGMINSSPYNVALYTVTQSGDTFSYVGGANISTGGNKPIPYFDPDTGKVLVTYRNGFGTANYYPSGRVVDCSPTTPTYGSEVVIESANSYPTIRATYDTTADKFICCYTQAASPQNAVYSVLEISGTSFTATTPTSFASNGYYPLPLYIPSLDKTAIAYWYYPTDPGNTKAVVASLSGTTLTFGTAVDVTLDSIWTEEAAVTYDTSQSKFVIAGPWYNTANTGADSNDGHVFFGTISGTDISFSGGFDFGGSDTVHPTNLIGATYDSTENKVVIAYGTTTTSTEGKAFSVNYVSAPSSGQNWYVQTDGTFATTAGTPSVKAGINISGTSLLLNGDS